MRKRNRIHMIAMAALTTIAAGGIAEANPKVTMSVKKGSWKTNVNVVAYLGKYKNGKEFSTPYMLKDCEIAIGKTFKVKDSGSKWRTYWITIPGASKSGFADIRLLKARSDSFKYWTRNGNTKGKTLILSQNAGKISNSSIEAAIDSLALAAEAAYPSSVPGNYGASQPTGTGLKVTFRGKYKTKEGGSWKNFKVEKTLHGFPEPTLPAPPAE